MCVIGISYVRMRPLFTELVTIAAAFAHQDVSECLQDPFLAVRQSSRI